MGKDMTERAEFSEKTRILVAKRAGYKCSYPNCGKLTIGPDKDPSKTVDTGIAAHIYSAALTGKGPRGTGDLSKSELESPENCIWLCAHHASLIDKRQGEHYPAELLHSFKTLHETRVAHELSGIVTPFGWIDRVIINSSPLFSGRHEISFAKLNLIIGKNSVGKTALCEWIAGASNPKYLERWEKVHPVNRNRLSTEVHYFYPDQHCIAVDFLSDSYPRYQADGELTFVSTGLVKTIFPKTIRFGGEDVPDDLDLVANALMLHRYEVKALCDEIGKHSDFFKGAWFEESEEGIYMHVDVVESSRIETRLFRGLASSEIERLLMELGIIAANKQSAMGPTLLILDANVWLINTDWLKRYAELLGSPTCRFQTIVSTVSTKIDFDEVTWSGWKVISLEGKPPNAVIYA